MASDLKRCQARSGQKPHLQCEILVPIYAVHSEDHEARDTDGLIFHWTNGTAIAEPVPQEIREGQVGGDHYKKFKIQPWDVWDEYDLDPYTANCLKYLMRAGYKGPKIEDLKKARHYLDKAIEREQVNGQKG